MLLSCNKITVTDRIK